MITITMQTDNEAMQSESEIARILHKLADNIDRGEVDESTDLHDVNGNTVGRMIYQEDSDD